MGVPVGLSKRPTPPFFKRAYRASMSCCWMAYGVKGNPSKEMSAAANNILALENQDWKPDGGVTDKK